MNNELEELKATTDAQVERLLETKRNLVALLADMKARDEAYDKRPAWQKFITRHPLVAPPVAGFITSIVILLILRAVMP